jgi:hypothetical protein
LENHIHYIILSNPSIARLEQDEIIYTSGFEAFQERFSTSTKRVAMRILCDGKVAGSANYYVNGFDYTTAKRELVFKQTPHYIE